MAVGDPSSLTEAVQVAACPWMIPGLFSRLRGHDGDSSPRVPAAEVRDEDRAFDASPPLNVENERTNRLLGEGHTESCHAQSGEDGGREPDWRRLGRELLRDIRPPPVVRPEAPIILPCDRIAHPLRGLIALVSLRIVDGGNHRPRGSRAKTP